jgi:sodium/hydrogen exchanger family protein
MLTLSDDQSFVLDREPDQEKSLGPSGPRIRCPLCGWSPREEALYPQKSALEVRLQKKPDHAVTVLEIDPASLVPALPLAVGLGVVTSFTKTLTGYWAARRAGIDHRGRLRAGMELVARGEFSIVIAGLGVAIEPRLGPLSAA